VKWPGDNDVKRKLSIIDEGNPRRVRMANLCVVTSHKVNGVAEIHSKLVKEDLFPEFNALWPDKFCNVTNGVTLVAGYFLVIRSWQICLPKQSVLNGH
jgi:Glucan phosphorylase